MNKHLILIWFPVQIGFVNRCGRKFSARHLLINKMPVGGTVGGIQVEDQTVGEGVRGNIVDVSFTTQTFVAETDTTLITAFGAIHGQSGCVVDKTQGEIGLNFQRFGNVREDTARNQGTSEFHGVDHEIIQIHDSKLIHSIVESVAVIHTAQYVRLVVENFSTFARLENRVVGVVSHTAFVTRNVNVQNTG